MIVKLLTEHHLRFLSLKGGCRGSSESTLIKMQHYWKSHFMAEIFVFSSYQMPTSMFSQPIGIIAIKSWNQI